MRPLHWVMNKLLELTKSLFLFKHTIVNYIVLGFAVSICTICYIPLPFGGTTWEVTRVFLASVCFSLILSYMYNGEYESLKNQKCKRYRVVFQREIRYRVVLWRLIFFKSLIFVPILMWIIFSVSLLIFNYRWSLDFWSSFFVSWVLWCVMLWIDRKIFRKNRISRGQKLPSSFYNKN